MAKRPEATWTADRRALAFLALAIASSASGTVIVNAILLDYEARIAQARAPVATTRVLIATGELFPGVPITESDVVAVEVPVPYVPEGAMTAPELVVGATPRERILPEEFILRGRLADGDAGVGLNGLVPPGMRAVSLALPDEKALSGFLSPGDRVDVIVSVADQGKLETITALQTVPVLAVNDQQLADERRQREQNAAMAEGRDVDADVGTRQKVSPSVTLALTPAQAEIAVHAQQIGKITLALRSDVDHLQVASDGTNTARLLNEEVAIAAPRPIGAAPAPAPVSAGVTIAIIRGDRVTERHYAPAVRAERCAADGDEDGDGVQGCEDSDCIELCRQGLL